MSDAGQSSAADNARGDHGAEKPVHNCTGDSNKVDGDTPNNQCRLHGSGVRPCQRGGGPSNQRSRRATSTLLAKQESNVPSVHFSTSWTAQGRLVFAKIAEMDTYRKVRPERCGSGQITFDPKHRSFGYLPKDQIASRCARLLPLRRSERGKYFRP